MTSNEKRALLNNVLLSAGLYVLDSVRRHLAENIKRAGVKAQDNSVDLRTSTSNVHSQAAGRDNRTILDNSRHLLDPVGAAIMGVGIGVAIGVMLAPASGEETRRNIEERVRSRFFEKRAA
jgi:hypothetical protein